MFLRNFYKSLFPCAIGAFPAKVVREGPLSTQCFLSQHCSSSLIAMIKIGFYFQTDISHVGARLIRMEQGVCVVIVQIHHFPKFLLAGNVLFLINV